MSQKVDPSPTRHADTPRSQKGLAPLTRDPWFTFLVWGTSCEHNFSWTFLAGLQALSPFTKLLKFWVLVCPSPTRHADTPRSQKGLAPLTRDPWFTFFVWGTSCEHNFSWTFRRPIFFWRFLTLIFQRVFDHSFFGLISCVKMFLFSRSRCIDAQKIIIVL